MDDQLVNVVVNLGTYVILLLLITWATSLFHDT
jgi:hypothetical protein